MRIGVPREIKNHEYRVGLVPAGVRELGDAGHTVIVESGAGVGVGLADRDYQAAGAQIASGPAEVLERAELIVKVKEPQPDECAALRSGQVLFTFLHLAADAVQALALLKSGVTAIAYETVTGENSSLPLLAPMSEVAGRMSVQVGAACLQKASGGPGVLLGGVPGVAPAHVVIIGGGVSGTNAVQMAIGMGADVTVLDRSMPRLRALSQQFRERLRTVYSTTLALEDWIPRADLVIGAVLVPGAAAPKVVSRKLLSSMRRGSVVVDIAIDQGGCFETSRPTTHDEPTYEIDGIIHYCVTNMPGAVPRTSTLALTNATLPYVRSLANLGWAKAASNDPGLALGVNVHAGKIMHAAVARELAL